MATLIDSYSETNQDAFSYLFSGTIIVWGESFTVGSNATLDSVKFYLRTIGSVSGLSVYAKAWNITGTPGTNSKPTGSAIAVSDAVDAGNIGTNFVLVTFTFSDSNRVSLTNGNYYFITCGFYSGDSSNKLYLGYDSSDPLHSGNSARSVDEVNWDLAYATSQKPCFYVYGEIPSNNQYTATCSDLFVLGIAGANDFVLGLSETLSLSQVYSSLVGFIKSLSETFSLTQVYTQASKFILSLNNTFSLSQAMTTLNRFSQIFAETFNLSQIITYITKFAQTFSETIGLSDVFSAILTATRNNFTLDLSEIIHISKVIITRFTETLSEIFSLSQAFSKVTRFNLALSNVFSLSQTITSVARFSKTFSETFSLIGTTIYSGIFSLSLSETIGLTDLALIAFREWEWISKHATSWTNQAKNLATYVFGTKHSTTFSNETKHATTWSQQTKNPTSWDWQKKNK